MQNILNFEVRLFFLDSNGSYANLLIIEAHCERLEISKVCFVISSVQR